MTEVKRRLTLRRDSSIADRSALSRSFFRKPWKKKKKTDTAWRLNVLQPTFPLSAYRAHALSLSLSPYFLEHLRLPRHKDVKGRGIGIVIKIAV